MAILCVYMCICNTYVCVRCEKSIFFKFFYSVCIDILRFKHLKTRFPKLKNHFYHSQFHRIHTIHSLHTLTYSHTHTHTHKHTNRDISIHKTGVWILGPINIHIQCIHGEINFRRHKIITMRWR